jgi:hypothetical protein
MPNDESLEHLKRVEEIAGRAGLTAAIDQETGHLQMRFALPADRQQDVFVRDSSAQGRRVVTFFSLCRVVKQGRLPGLAKEMAMELLRANARLHFARYGIWEFEESQAIVASCDCLLDTLDPDECHNAAWSVAFAADRFEHEHGRDDF